MPDTHPWVVWASVVVAVLTIAAAAVPKVRELVRPILAFVGGFRIRRIERLGRIEAAAAVLNDQRVELLSVQLSGVAAQLDSVLRQSREDSTRYQSEIASLRTELAATKAELAASRVEIAALRAELAEYRGAQA
ncbi:hypothetical protein ACQPW1_09965 [Nocardia sp. CA-128927]|uniref:hypothetical protein n=1 Tax=Nocardia sp. CA-128927 TaxID=3239975 RepID=UPI003D958E05